MANPQQTQTAASDKTAPPEKKWRWLTYNLEGTLGLPLRPTANPVTKMLTLDSSPIHLIPGANLVEEKKWKAWKAQHPDREEDGEMVMGEHTRLTKTKIPRAAHANRRAEAAGSVYLVEGPLVAMKTAPLAGLTDDEAIAIVEELRVEEALRRYLQIERRSRVAEALRKQLDLITQGVVQRQSA